MELAFWRDLSVIWLSLFCFIGLAIPLVVLYFVVRRMNALHDSTYRLLLRAQSISHQVPAQTEQVAARVSEPVIQLQRQTTQAETFLKSLLVNPDRNRRSSGRDG